MREDPIAAYRCTGPRWRLIEQHAGLVKRIAHHLMARLPRSVQVDDLIQAGMVGLLEADGKYDANKGASFETYAGIRIRGAMLDEVRKGDWAPRSVHRNARRVAEAMAVVESRLGREASDQEIADHLGLSSDEYFAILRDAASCRLSSLDEIERSDDEAVLPSADVPGPMDGAEQGAFRDALLGAIDELSEREQLVISLYYDEELNLKEIGEVLEVSESRVSQIHSKAMLKLRGKLDRWSESGD